MGASRSKFDWSILDRQSLIDYFYSLYPEICDQKLSVDKIHAKISRHIKKYAPVRLSKKRDVKVDDGWIWVGGTYYSDWDREKRQCIELVLVYNLFQEKIILTKRRYERVCYTLADTLLHEIMHMRQYRRRKFKDLPDYASTAAREEKRQEQEYLGNSDEVDAYSFNIACELMDKFNGNSKLAFEYLNEKQKGKNRKHNCWRMYLKAFDHDHNHPIIQRVKKKVIRYMPHALNGKPYRNKDWISR
jgi:hypothetical protein